jgi:exosortase C (VPDSG-CTERM-specific)
MDQGGELSMSASMVHPKKTEKQPQEVSVPMGRFLIFAIILSIGFCGPVISLMMHAAGSSMHSYAVLIPLVVAYLIHLRRGQLPKNCDTAPLEAAILIAFGAFALGAPTLLNAAVPAASEIDRMTLQVLAYLLWLVAGAFAFLGRQWMKVLAFPVCFLFFMIPLPDAWVNSLETASKMASAEVASWFFSLSGLAVFRDGPFFQLPGVTLEVAQECSGIRSSVVLFITALLLSNLMLASSWKRALLVAFVVPLGVVRNAFRILVLGVLAVEVDPSILNGAIHKRGGPVFFVLSLIPLGLLLWWLRRKESRREPGLSPAAEGMSCSS